MSGGPWNILIEQKVLRLLDRIERLVDLQIEKLEKDLGK